jgi:hypothetical protein
MNDPGRTHQPDLVTIPDKAYSEVEVLAILVSESILEEDLSGDQARNIAQLAVHPEVQWILSWRSRENFIS